MKKLRNRFERFCFRHRNWGVPNLMFYVTLGTALVYLLTNFTGNYGLYAALYFDRNLILQGQVWRLFTYIFTYAVEDSILWLVIGLICYYSLGRAIENTWGTFRFNLFYFSGMVLMDLWGMITGMPADIYYVNFSLFLAYATLYPDAQFLILFIIPVKAWALALVYLALTLLDVISILSAGYFFYALFPLVPLSNYFLFFGKDVLNVIPRSWRINARRLFKRNPAKKTGTIPFPTAGSYEATTATVKVPYTHKCAVCGRTDVSNPELEFRYCSRCSGYQCYCEDHIHDHTHVE